MEKNIYKTNDKLNIGHLKELTSKIINPDKNLTHIIYNNNKYIFPNDKIFLKNLIPKGQQSTKLSLRIDDNKKEYNN